MSAEVWNASIWPKAPWATVNGWLANSAKHRCIKRKQPSPRLHLPDKKIEQSAWTAKEKLRAGFVFFLAHRHYFKSLGRTEVKREENRNYLVSYSVQWSLWQIGSKNKTGEGTRRDQPILIARMVRDLIVEIAVIFVLMSRNRDGCSREILEEVRCQDQEI